MPLNKATGTPLHLGPNNPIKSYYIDKTRINVAESHKDIVVTISQDLMWKFYITQIVKKAVH